MSATVTARGPIKVVATVNADELLDIAVPDGKPRFVLTIRLPDGIVTADLAAKSVRRANAWSASTGPRRWPPSSRAGCPGARTPKPDSRVQPKGPKPEQAEAAA